MEDGLLALTLWVGPTADRQDALITEFPGRGITCVRRDCPSVGS